MATMNTSKLVLNYNPIATGVAETAVRRLLGDKQARPKTVRHLRLVQSEGEKNAASFPHEDQPLRVNVPEGELFGFTFSGWVRTLVSSVAETENTMTNLINKSGPELVTIYNTVAKLIGEKDVNRFATKSAAVDRTARLLAILNGKRHDIYDATCVALGLKDAPKAVEPKVLVVEVPAISLTPEVKPAPAPAPAPEAPKPALKPPVKAAPKAAKEDGIDAVEDKAHKQALKEASAKRMAAEVVAKGVTFKPAAVKATEAKPAAKAPGRIRDFNFKPFSVHRVPRDGSYLAEALARLTKGCQYADMVALVNELDAKRGRGTLAKGSDSVDRRAYELIRDLHFLNGYGIRHNPDNGLIEAYTFTKG
jgi:hypothetical protein